MVQPPGRRRVTVIDDSPELRAVFGDVLGLDGMDVSLFDASSTLSEIIGSAPDVLVTDLRHGDDGCAGLEFIRLARSDAGLRDVSIIVCSAATDHLLAHDQELSRTRGVFVLRKPFSLDELESCVAEALSARIALSANDGGDPLARRSGLTPVSPPDAS